MYNYDIVMRIGSHGINALAGYSLQQMVFVLNSVSTDGEYLHEGKLIDPDNLVKGIKNIVEDIQSALKKPYRNLLFVFPPFTCAYTQRESMVYNTTDEWVTPKTGRNLTQNFYSQCQKKLNKSTIEIASFLPYQYRQADSNTSEGNHTTSFFPNGVKWQAMSISYLLTIFPHDFVANLKKLLADNGIERYRLYAGPVGAARFFAVDEKFPKDYYLFDISQCASYFTKVQNSLPVVSQPVNWGWSNITEQVAQSLNLELAKASEYLQLFGFSAEPEYEFQTPEGVTMTKLSKALNEALQPLVAGFKVFLKNEKDEKYASAPVELTGRPAGLIGLSEYLTKNCQHEFTPRFPTAYGAREGDKSELLGVFLWENDIEWLYSKDEGVPTIVRQNSKN